MNLQQLEISPEEATEKLAEYEQAVRERHNAEDAAIAAGYRAAKRGHPVISLPRAIQAAGFFENGLPRLAVTRATARECFAWWDGPNLIFSGKPPDGWHHLNRGALVNMNTVRVPVEPPAEHKRGLHRYWTPGQTAVPLIPPRHRLPLRRLRNCHLLWEAESWTSVPPVDPALIKHLRGELWAVLATWDLTELERLVLSQR